MFKMFCIKCGKKLEDGQAFCQYCGAKCGTAANEFNNGMEDVEITTEWMINSYGLAGLMFLIMLTLFGISWIDYDVKKYLLVAILSTLFVFIMSILCIVVNKRYYYTMGKLIIAYDIFTFTEAVLFISMFTSGSLSGEALDIFCVFAAIQLFVSAVFFPKEITSFCKSEKRSTKAEKTKSTQSADCRKEIRSKGADK